MNRELAQRIVSENPAFVSADDGDPVELVAQMVLDRMQDEAVSFPEHSQEREQLMARIGAYGAETTQQKMRRHVQNRSR